MHVIVTNCRYIQREGGYLLIKKKKSILYLHLKHCNTVIQHLYTHCEHFSSFPRCCWRCSTTSIHTSWCRMTVRHLCTLHTKTFYIIHFRSSIILRNNCYVFSLLKRVQSINPYYVIICNKQPLSYCVSCNSDKSFWSRINTRISFAMENFAKRYLTTISRVIFEKLIETKVGRAICGIDYKIENLHKQNSRSPVTLDIERGLT